MVAAEGAPRKSRSHLTPILAEPPVLVAHRAGISVMAEELPWTADAVCVSACRMARFERSSSIGDSLHKLNTLARWLSARTHMLLGATTAACESLISSNRVDES